MTRAYIALGANLGDRVANIDAALDALAATPGISVVDVSSIFESEPWGGVDQPPYANAVAGVETDIGALQLLRACLRIERELGRVPGERFGPRPIDLDLLLYDGETIDSPELMLPHPRMLERDFVVTPLLEIAPFAKMPDGHPVTHRDAVSGRITAVLRRRSASGGAADEA